MCHVQVLSITAKKMEIAVTTNAITTYSVATVNCDGYISVPVTAHPALS